jgi:hypothetical protein
MDIPADELQGIRHVHAETLRQCEALSRIVLCAGQGAPLAFTRRNLVAVLNWFDSADLGRREGADLATRHGSPRWLWSRLRRQLLDATAMEVDDHILQDTEAFIQATRAQVQAEAEALEELAHA